MNNQEQTQKKCRRCRKSVISGDICQNCKNELLSNYEASNDWQTAYEIERAQLIASRYQNEDLEEDENYY
jgi:methionyl-tRNA synthetase